MNPAIAQLLVKFLASQPKKPDFRTANLFHQATPAKGKYRLTTNHGKGESKKRAKMAAASNKINRQRCNHWKH